jgi:hypothetical protein
MISLFVITSQELGKQGGSSRKEFSVNSGQSQQLQTCIDLAEEPGLVKRRNPGKRPEKRCP